jgi:long-chain acyl-CoA synthetase
MNVATLLHRSAHAFPEAPALALGARPVATYGELAASVARLARALREDFALAPGDRVALAMRNCPEFFVVLFAAWHAGLAAVPINFRLHRQEFRYILEHSGARLCFATADLAATLAGLDAQIETLAAIVDAQGAGFARLTEDARAAMPCADAAPDDPAWLFYTSGTTGRPKGATLTHRNLGFMIHAYFADVDTVSPGDAMVHAAALSHGAGLYALPSIAQGGTQVISESASFDPAEALALVASHRNVTLWAAPTMLTRLTHVAHAEDHDTRNLRTIVYGGAPMYVADLERALDVFGPKLVQIFGQGESPMTITSLGRDDHLPAHLPTCGRARTLVEVRIVDADGRDVPAGESGEIVTRSDCVMRGYWNNPQASAETLRGGWLHTGDLGSLDARGYLTLKDRAKDMIISGGSNIYPREIEEALLTHAAVVEAAVVGRPHPDWGEEVVAFVVARPGAEVTEAELDRLCLERIARYKRPRAYRFVASLPKNNYGKVLKTELRAALAARAADSRTQNQSTSSP